MSKMDDLRAMREARYAEAQRRAASTPARPKPPVAPRLEPTSKETPVAAPSGVLCGHRNMSGRTCTRESGHPQKSHRYS